MIHWLCPKPASPSGGVWFLHRLCRLANELGYLSKVVRSEPFEVWWDPEPMPPEQISRGVPLIGQGDTIVCPEVIWPPSSISALGVRNICFVQNYIWLAQNLKFLEKDQVITCSRFLDNHMKRVYGVKPVGLLTPWLDDYWQPTPKIANLTLVSTRHNHYTDKLIPALEAAKFPVLLLDHAVTQKELYADYLSKAEFYVHLVHPEGWPMACVEAMLSGVIVCGTTGGGGNEFMFHGETARVVQDPENGQYGSADEFVRRILEQMEILRSDAVMRSRIWQQARNFILSRYSKQRTSEQLKAILG